MKMTLIAVAALSATGAFAQVTVYGRLDAGYASSSDTTYGKTVTDSGIKSHNSVSSMWGITGTEDLGGGNKAYFKLEQDIYTADGNQGVSGAAGGTTNGASFDRTSLIGLMGNFGTVSLGRDYNPLFNIVAGTDINSLSRVSTVELAAATGGSTVANQVIYLSPVMSGFQLKAAFGNDDNSTSTNGVTGGTTTATSAVNVTYTNGPLFLAAATGGSTGQNGTARGTAVSYYATTGGVASGASMGSALVGVTTAQSITANALGASYDFGKFKLVGNYISSVATNTDGPTASGNMTATQLNLGVTVPTGKLLWKAQASANTLKWDNNANSNMTGNNLVLGVDYSLSAKTALFLTGGTFNNLSNEVYNQSSHSTAVGIKTVF